MKETQYTSSRWLLAAVMVMGLTCAQARAEQYPDMPKTGPDYDFSRPATTNFGIFKPPIDSNLTVNINTPQIAEWTRSNKTNDTMALTGENLSSFTGSEEGRDTRFVIYGEGRPETDGLIQRLDGQQCAVTLSTNLPPDEMYLMWPHNDSGYGEPVRINGAELWWANNYVAKGTTFRVFGQNLTLGSTTSYLYIEELDKWMTNTTANPYMAEYTFPPDAAAGTYTVYAHNGHGGKYGWAEPLSITVWNGYQFTDSGDEFYDVTKHGLVGDGTTDNRDALASLWNSVKNSDTWPTLYFPAGNYLIQGTSEVSIDFSSCSGVRFLGDGTNSIISCQTPTIGEASIELAREKVVFKNLSIAKLDTGFTWQSTSAIKQVENGTANHTLFEDVLFDDRLADAYAEYGRPMYWTVGGGAGPTDLRFLNCDIISNRHWDLGASYVTYEGCNFWGMDDCGGYAACSISQFALINSTNYTHWDNSNVYSGAGWGKGRWFNSGANKSSINWYLGGNTSTNAQPRYYIGIQLSNPGDGSDGWNDVNAGEQFMKEGGVSKYRGAVVSATSNTVTFADVSSYITSVSSSWTAVIVHGKGFGQSRSIASISDETLTLTDNWRVEPDSSSAIVIGTYATRWAIYDNNLHSDLSAYTYDTCASAAVELYYGGGAHTFIVDGNTFTGLKEAFRIEIDGTKYFNEPYGTVSPAYFLRLENNTVNSTVYGVHEASGLDWEVTAGMQYPDDVLIAANVVRGNVFDGITGAVFLSGDTNTVSRQMMILDGNLVTNTVGVLSSAEHGRDNDIWINNTFYGSGNGIHLLGNPVAMRDNVFSGFTSNWFGVLPGGSLELPSRIAFADATKASGTIPVWNSGTDVLDWNASEPSPWLTLVQSSGTAVSESGVGALTYELVSTPETGSKAVITITGGGKTRTVTVVYEGKNAVSTYTYSLIDYSGTPLRAHVYDVDTDQTFYVYDLESLGQLEFSSENLKAGHNYRWKLQQQIGNNWVDIAGEQPRSFRHE